VFLNEICDEEEARLFLSFTLPAIILFALDLPNVVQRPIPLLMPNVKQEKFLTLSQHQIVW